MTKKQKKAGEDKKDSQKEKFKQIISSLPKTIGVYRILDEEGRVIYVGKAKNIRERLKGHLLVNNPSARTLKMRKLVASVEFTETTNEVEALVLEANLIKELKPKFNILLRDDKRFVFIKVTVKEDFPRVVITRETKNDGAKYFGPKTRATAARKIVDLLQRIFKFRICGFSITENEQGKIIVKDAGATKIPCLEADIKKCDAPCVGGITKEEYGLGVRAALDFLRGNTAAIRKAVEEKMQNAALKKRFEEAAKWRDLLRDIAEVGQNQVAEEAGDFEADVIGAVNKFDTAFFHLFQIREGKIINSDNFHLPLGENLTESLEAFLREHFALVQELPKKIILSKEIFPEAEKEKWQEYLGQKAASKLEILLPQKGKRKQILNLAELNAKNYARRSAPKFIKHQDTEETLEALKESLALTKLPKRIEAYDISHLQGTETVGSMVVLLDGEPAKSHYRKFKIRSLKAGEIDDFKAMEEVIYRRLRKLPRKLPKSFELRKAQKKDQDIIEQKLKKCKGDLREFDYRQWLILKLQDELIGLLRVREVDTKNSALISDLFLDEQFNGQGLSQFLLKKAVSQVKARKYYAICPKNSELEIFERFGFKLARHKPKELVSKSRNNCNYLVYTRQKLDQSFTSVPDLILIDGGKGQLSAALKSSSRFPELKIPICALAKREEQVFIPGKPEPTPITKDSRPGLLLQKIRDEAHRFAVSFNRNLRSSKAHLSALDQIEGIGPTTRKKLLRKFGSLANIKKASDEELLKLVNAKVLYRIKKL